MTGLNTHSEMSMATLIHEERTINNVGYLASNRSDLVSVEFIMQVYSNDAAYWTEPMSKEDSRLMIQNSCIIGIYRQQQHHAENQSLGGNDSTEASDHTMPAHSPEQIGMARFVTDHVTHAYLTDIFVAPEVRGQGLGSWLVQCCDAFIDRIPHLRKAMLCTSNPKRNASFYQERLGMSIPVQDPERHLVMMRRRGGAAFPSQPPPASSTIQLKSAQGGES